jgi:hypothetical protein
MVTIDSEVLSFKVMAFNLRRDLASIDDIKNAWDNPSKGVWYY